jgi:hypothetical protein
MSDDVEVVVQLYDQVEVLSIAPGKRIASLRKSTKDAFKPQLDYLAASQLTLKVQGVQLDPLSFVSAIGDHVVTVTAPPNPDSGTSLTPLQHIPTTQFLLIQWRQERRKGGVECGEGAAFLSSLGDGDEVNGLD